MACGKRSSGQIRLKCNLLVNRRITGKLIRIDGMMDGVKSREILEGKPVLFLQMYQAHRFIRRDMQQKVTLHFGGVNTDACTTFFYLTSPIWTIILYMFDIKIHFHRRF